MTISAALLIGCFAGLIIGMLAMYITIREDFAKPVETGAYSMDTGKKVADQASTGQPVEGGVVHLTEAHDEQLGRGFR